MLAKRFRRWVSWIAIGVVGFAQIAIALHACPVEAAAKTGLTAAASTTPGNDPCGGMENAPTGAQGSACESHCANAIVAPAQPDPPGTGFVALPAPPTVAVEVRVSHRAAGEGLVAVSRAPPVTLQFCRLLI